jgi:hypothetical protein
MASLGTRMTSRSAAIRSESLFRRPSDPAGATASVRSWPRATQHHFACTIKRLNRSVPWRVSHRCGHSGSLVLIQQGCDLEGDVLPIVARELPELGRVGRPLRNWGAPWLVRALSTVRLPWLSIVRGDSPRTSDNPPYRWSVSVDHRGLFGINRADIGPPRSDMEPRPADAPASTSLPPPGGLEALIDKAGDRRDVGRGATCPGTPPQAGDAESARDETCNPRCGHSSVAGLRAGLPIAKIPIVLQWQPSGGQNWQTY